MSESTWDLSDGLPGDFDGEIVDTQFTYHPRYNNGQSCVAQFNVKSFDSEVEDQVILYSIGDNWEPANKGSEARWVGKGKPRINRQSSFGIFIANAAKAAGETLRGRGEPHEGKTWTGLAFHWDRESYTDMGGKERSRLIPTALVGSKATYEGKAATNGHAEVTIPAKIRTALMRAAAESGSHEAFVEKALTLDGVTDEMRPAILSTQEGSIWATMNS